MRVTCLAILIMTSLMLAGCHRDQPHALSAATQLKPGFSGWVAANGVYLRYYNDTVGAVLINTYSCGYHISGTDNEATSFSEYPKMPKPMEKDWVLVAPHAHHDFGVAAYSGMRSAPLDPCGSYTVKLYTPTDEPPKRLLGTGVTVIRPEGSILIQP